MLLQELAEYISQHTSLTPGQTLYIGYYPDQPDTILALYDTGGGPRQPGLKDLRRTLQVITRSKDYKAAHDWAWTAFNLLDRDFLPLPSGRKLVCRANQPPTPLTRDHLGRSLFVFNLTVWTSNQP